ncbi:MAG: response regulator, partial [Caldithrix sp.]|nr:response regulator [Caldithrix sp.]
TIKIDNQRANRWSIQREGNYVQLDVADTGSGIPEEVRERMFEPFFTTKEVGKGTGLGLSTSQSIIKAHGGFIDVQSQPEKGTIFRLYLPELQGKSIPHKDKEDAEIHAGNGQNILVIDDEQAIREIMNEVLVTKGFGVTTAEEGQKALQIYREKGTNTFDAVITDMAMPNMDGLTTIKALKKMNPDVKILAISGFSESMDSETLNANGVYHWLNKPYTGDQLLNKLNELLEGV